MKLRSIDSKHHTFRVSPTFQERLRAKRKAQRQARRQARLQAKGRKHRG